MSILRNRGFALLLSGQALGFLALWCARTMVLIWVYSLTNSGVGVSLVGVSEALPLLVMAPLAGVLVDRWHRNWVLAGAALAQALFTLPLLLVNDAREVPLILLTTLLWSTASQFYQPAAGAAVQVLVKPAELGQANSLLQLAGSVAPVIAPGLGAFLYGAIGPHALVVVVVALLALTVPIGMLVPAGLAVRAGTAASTVVREMHAGLAYVRRSRLLLSIISVAMVAFLGAGALSVLDVVFVTRALHQPSDTVGVLLVASGLGQLAGGILSFQFAPRLAHMYHRVLAVSIAFSGVMVLIYSVTPSLESAVVVLFIGGLGFPVMFMAFMTMIQIAVENAFMGRVMSLISTCMAVVMIISTAAGGALTDVFGVRQVIAAGGVSLVAGGLLALRLVRSMPEKRAEEPAAAPVESPSLAT